MKLIFAGAMGMALCAAPVAAYAQESNAECAVIGFAQSIMEGRQDRYCGGGLVLAHPA